MSKEENGLTGCLTPAQRDQLLLEISGAVKGIGCDLKEVRDTVYGVGNQPGLKTDVEKIKFLWPVLYSLGLVIIFFVTLFVSFK